MAWGKLDIYCLGGVHGLYQIIGEELRPFKQKWTQRFCAKRDSFSYRLGQIVVTFVLVDLAWIFFRADTIRDAAYYIIRIFTKPDPWSFFNETIYTLGLSVTELNILFISLLFLLFVEIHKYLSGEGIVDFLEKQCLWFQWGIIFAGISAVLIYGAYGAAFDPQQFIYFQF